jgi:two-component system nitrogen regulation response regulator NtrX
MAPNATLATKPIILVVDDEVAILTSMANILEDDGVVVETTSNPDLVLDLIGTLVPDLVFLDIFIPNANGIDILSLIKKEYPSQKVIIISGYGNISLAVDALKKGALDFIEKPFSIDDILNKISLYCPVGDYQVELSAMQPQETGLVGESYLFKELIIYIDRIVPLSNHVLIYGPRGIGKTHLARYMHNKKNTFTKSCTEISSLQNPKLTIDLSIFRQEGSIIIKQVELLSKKAQKGLLRLLESSETKARIFCLTDKNLFSLTTQGHFNEDLFYSINSTPIEIPSLNKRRFDIPLLVHHYLTGINKESKSSHSFTTEAIRFLRNHTWQQHCRELKQLMIAVTANMKSSSQIITLAHIRPFLHEADYHFVEEQGFRTFSSLQEATLLFQKKFLLYQLKKNRYDLEQVSNLLSMDVVDLRNELQRLDISLSL